MTTLQGISSKFLYLKVLGDDRRTVCKSEYSAVSEELENVLLESATFHSTSLKELILTSPDFINCSLFDLSLMEPNRVVFTFTWGKNESFPSNGEGYNTDIAILIKRCYGDDVPEKFQYLESIVLTGISLRILNEVKNVRGSFGFVSTYPQPILSPELLDFYGITLISFLVEFFQTGPLFFAIGWGIEALNRPIKVNE